MFTATSATGASVPGLFGAVNDFARSTGWLHAPLMAYASYGLVLFAGLLVVGWWLARVRGPRAMAAALWAGGAMLLAVAVNQPLARSVHEARPYTLHPAILVLAHRSADFSFPSDHAVMAGAVAAGLWLVSKRLGVVAAVAALVMGFARVYVAAHYPHDVFAGFALGAGVVLVGWLLLARPLTRLVEWLAQTPLRPMFVDDRRAPADVPVSELASSPSNTAPTRARPTSASEEVV
jgi:membrane-associated phospholipid phosphatase